MVWLLQVSSQSPKQYMHVYVSVVLIIWIGFSLLLRTFFLEALAKAVD